MSAHRLQLPLSGPLWRAAADFLWLQDCGYPRQAVLTLVGNRYDFNRDQREILHRGIFPSRDALTRRGKRILGAAWTRRRLMVDGHNVHITVESALLGRPMVLANDGALRDVAGLSSRYRMNEISFGAAQGVVRFLRLFVPREVLFFFDSPMSKSGEIAALYRRLLRRFGLSGDSLAVAVPEKLFDYRNAVIASSDHVVLDEARLWLDLARRTIDYFAIRTRRYDFSKDFTTEAQGTRR